MGEFLDAALELLEQMLTRPTFPEEELRIYAAKRREQMAADNKKPGYIARRAFVEALFGEDHPYGRFASPEKIMELTRGDLQAFFDMWLHAGNMFAVASGNIDEKTTQRIVRFLDALPRGSKPQEGQVPPAAMSTAQTRYVVREEAVQSSLRLGRVVPGKGHEDYIALQLLTTVLGGYFSSRLMQNLREDKGYTYGVYASVVALQHAAYLAIGCEVGAEHERSAIREIHHEMLRLTVEPIGEDELRMAKNTIVGELMRILDGPFGIADVSIENIQSGEPTDYINIFLARINALTTADLMAVARKYYDPVALTEVCVGPHALDNAAQSGD